MEDVAARQPDRLLEVNRVLASSPQEQRSAVGAWQQRDGLVAGASIAKISSLAISRHPAEALGFVPPDETVRVAELRETPLELFCVDRELMDIFETQTQMLRLLDRRLGSAVQAAQISAHVQQIASVLHRCVGRDRPSVARGLTEAAALAGWQALDRADVTAAWEFHETAKAAALEGADAAVAAHVVAQQGLVLLDAEQPRVARESVQAAITRAGSTPPIMRSWLAAAAAECHASLGDAQATRRCLEHAESLLAAEDGTELPYLMLTAEHLARWRAHCLAKLGDREAVDAAAAAIHDPHEAMLTVVARVEHTAYVLLSPDEQARRVDGWGRVLAALASSGRVARLQILESALPDSGDGILGWWQHHGVGAEPNFVRKQYDTLMRTYAPSASTHRRLIAIAVSEPARSTWTPGPLKGLEMLRQEMARSNPGCAPPTCASSPGSPSPNSRR